MGCKATLEIYDNVTTDDLLVKYADNTIKYQMAVQEAVNNNDNITMGLSLVYFNEILPIIEELAKREANGEDMLNTK